MRRGRRGGLVEHELVVFAFRAFGGRVGGLRLGMRGFGLRRRLDLLGGFGGRDFGVGGFARGRLGCGNFRGRRLLRVLGGRGLRGLRFLRGEFALLHLRDQQIRQRRKAAVDRQLHFRLGTAVRDEQVFQLEAVHAGPDRFQLVRRDRRVAFEQAQHRAAPAIELLQFRAAPLQAADLALGQRGDFRTAEAADERRGQASVEHGQDVQHALGLDRELVREGLHDRNGSHGIRLGAGG